ncbi:STN domain-containing protein [Rhodopseudomonas sp. P2A-2r]|uniref:STN domain-containing protein n=1 Tax=Rhodopseudomonas sp. P2A-2r TaxID=2991972 RepID=UPI0022344375|nr:STN domain-containing protein [Rhodopseudomonas sp. P2A-2r]UZE50517.1 STN domain-containing protein [Rhodopseudomonas sp. P2A-2r]
MLAVVCALSVGAVSAQQAVSLDIPAQPLARALFSFSAATGVEVLVDARHAAGRRSFPVKGAMPPRQALTLLLTGSNLIAREYAPGTITLSATEPTAPSATVEAYFAEIQRAVRLGLCSDAVTAPGHYRLALKLWIGPGGEIVRSKRLDTTGDDARDLAVDVAMSKITIGTPPPAEFSQPVALVVSRATRTTAALVPSARPLCAVLRIADSASSWPIPLPPCFASC